MEERDHPQADSKMRRRLSFILSHVVCVATKRTSFAVAWTNQSYRNAKMPAAATTNTNRIVMS